MQFRNLRFGSVEIDGVIHGQDVVIDHGETRKRQKKASKRFRAAYGHTPVSLEEEIPWQCRRLVIGTGIDGALPVMPGVRARAQELGVELIELPTARAITFLEKNRKRTNAILHLTC